MCRERAKLMTRCVDAPKAPDATFTYQHTHHRSFNHGAFSVASPSTVPAFRHKRNTSAMSELNFPNAVRDEKDFYGRKAELERIEGVLLSSKRIPLIIIGERRIGKTSIQNIIIRRLRA